MRNLKLDKLSLEEKICQKIIIGMDTPNAIDKIENLITKYKIGGILLYKKNYKNIEELINLINHIKELNRKNNVPMFIAIDQEGGRVNRLPNELENIPAPYKLSKLENAKEYVQKAGEITGNTLHRLGFNMNFAPVLDIKRFPDNHAIGDRAFSENIEEVTEYGIVYMKKLQENQIVSVVKHFPGHGATNSDSHFKIPKIKEKINDLEVKDMKPFKKAIENGADAVLVGHMRIKDITINPASISRKFITKYLKKKYRFNGLVVTDDMRMKAMKYRFGANKSIIKAFEAGNDIIVFKYDKGIEVLNEVINMAKSGKIKMNQIDNSVNKILNIKDKYEINNDKIELVDNEYIEKINEQIKEIRDKCKNK